MKTLNIKKMVKDMSFKDKAKILIANENHKYDSQYKDHLITSGEEDIIVKECREKGQITELNRLIRLFNLTTLAIGDVMTASLQLELTITRVNMYVYSIYIYGQIKDSFDRISSSIKSKKNKEITEVAHILEEQAKEYSDKYSFFYPSEDKIDLDDSAEKEKCFKVREPDKLLQKLFVKVLNAYKHLKKTLYIIEFLSIKGDMNFVSKKDEMFLEKAKELLKIVEDLDEFLCILKVYQVFVEEGLIKDKDYVEPCFIDLLVDYKKALELTDEERLEMEEKVKNKL